MFSESCLIGKDCLCTLKNEDAEIVSKITDDLWNYGLNATSGVIGLDYWSPFWQVEYYEGYRDKDDKSL